MAAVARGFQRRETSLATGVSQRGEVPSGSWVAVLNLSLPTHWSRTAVICLKRRVRPSLQHSTTSPAGKL